MTKNSNEINSNQDFSQEPRAYETATFLTIIGTGIIGAIIGMQLVCTVGITANTSIMGALFAILVGYIPLKALRKFKDIQVQNFIQTSISGATFAAGNVMMLALGIAWLYGDKQLLMPMFIGAAIGMSIDVTMMYWLFDTPTFPGYGTWPVAVATSETILSAKEGGKRALTLLGATVVGAFGQFLKLPMDICGVSLIGNKIALLMFGIGLLTRAYAPQIIGIDINKLYIPHGLMIGAGLVSIVQLGIALVKSSKKKTSFDSKEYEVDAISEQEAEHAYITTKNAADTKKILTKGSILFIAGTIVTAILAGLYSEMNIPMFMLWILYTGLTCIVAELIIGMAAMHAGWFPAFATSLIFLVLGMFMGFPAKALVILIGFKVCTGPAFADMGYDLKTGWILRGKNKNIPLEIFGRREQYKANFLGVIVGIVVTLIGYKAYFLKDLFPPVAKVFITTIQAGAKPEIVMNLITWAIVGAVIQAIGGTSRQMGILLATGLLILNPMGGFVVLATLAVRFILEKVYGEKINNTIYAVAAGFIVGSSLYGFFSNSLSAFSKKSK